MFSRTVLMMFYLVTGALAQVPPGQPYDRDMHVNPIVTFVERSDFTPVAYEDARALADIELLGLSADDGSLDTLSISPRRVGEVELLGRKMEALFFPVVVQKFQLSSGTSLELYSFKNPRVDLPSDLQAAVLDTEAFRKADDPTEGRFGLSNPPEQLQIRGTRALLFENDGELALFWQEGGESHVAVSEIQRGVLFFLVEDLL